VETSFSREMGFSQSEFFRILPSALNGREYLLKDSKVTLTTDHGQVTIEVGEQQIRKIASFSLPYIEVKFRFVDFEQSNVDEFMRYFELRYQRGGG